MSEVSPVASPDVPPPDQRPDGASSAAPGSDGKIHWFNIKGNDLGVAPDSMQEGAAPSQTQGTPQPQSSANWFTQNAPQNTPKPTGNWFAQNAPPAQAAPSQNPDEAITQATGLSRGTQQFHTGWKWLEGENAGSAWETKSKLGIPSAEEEKQFLEGVMDDVKNGSANTWIGSVLKRMGAKGYSYGVPEALGKTMAGPVAGIPEAMHGVTEVQSGHPIKGANEVFSGAGTALGPWAVKQPEALPFIATAELGGNLAASVAKAVGADEDTQELVKNVAGLFAGGKSVSKSHLTSFETSVNTHIEAQKEFIGRTREHQVAEQQAVTAGQAAEAARKAEFDNARENADRAERGEIIDRSQDQRLRQATIEAENNASAARANAKKARQALTEAEEAKNVSGYKMRAIARDMSAPKKTSPTSAQQDLHDQVGAKEDYQRVIEPAKVGKKGYYNDTDLEVRDRYAEAAHKDNPINTVEDEHKMLSDSIEKIDDQVKAASAEYEKQPIATNPKMDVVDAMSEREGSRANWTEKGLNSLINDYNLTDPTIGEALQQIHDLNDELRNWEGKSSDPEFVAKSAAVQSLRNGVMLSLERMGVEGVADLRQDMASLYRVRDAAYNALGKGDKIVRGSGQSGLLRKAAVLGAQAGIHTAGVGVGTAIGHALLPGPGGYIGGIVGEGLVHDFAHNFGKKYGVADLTRNELLQRRMQKTVSTGTIPAVRGGNNVSLPGADAIPVTRDGSSLHADLATHYGQMMGTSSYKELETRFTQDIEDKQAHGIPLEPAEKTLLAKINQQNFADATAAQKAAVETAAKGQPPTPTATLPVNGVDPREIPGLENGMTTEEGLVHEIVHDMVKRQTLGDKLPSLGVRSEVHPNSIKNKANATVAFDWSHYLDENKKLDVNKAAADIDDLAAMFVSGGVANDLWHDIPLDENKHLGQDWKILTQIMNEAGFTPDEQVQIIDRAGKRVKQFLQQPGIRDIIEQHAGTREPGLRDEMHISPERLDQIHKDIEVHNENKGNTSGVSGESARKPKADDTGGKGKVQGEVAEPVREARKRNAKARSGSAKEAKPEPGKAEGEVLNPALSEDERKIATIEPNSFGYMRPDGSVEQGSRNEVLHEVGTHHDLALKKGDNMTDIMSSPGGVKYGTGRKGAFVKIENTEPKTIANALKVLGSLPTEDVDFEFSKPGERPVDFSGDPRRVSGQVRRQFAEPYDLGEFDANPALSRPEIPEKTTGVPEHDEAIRSMGAVPGGHIRGNPEAGFESHALFHDPTSESTLALPFSKVTPENVARELNKNRLDYAKATGKYTANTFNAETNRNPINPRNVEHNPAVAKRIADAFDAAKHEPENPAVKKSYEAVKRDIDDQWDYATKKMGIKFEPWEKEGQPYKGSKDMQEDVQNNKHLYFYRGGEMPANHALAATDPKTGFTYNDKLRAVHDLFGHAEHGFQFGPKGEENAWNVHRQMFSPEAIPAITTETRGQNSWVNFGKHLRNAEGNIPGKGEPGYVAPPDRPFAEQKAFLLPEEFHKPNAPAETPFAHPGVTPGENFNPALSSPFAKPKENLGGRIPTNAEEELAAVEPELAKREARRAEIQRDMVRHFTEATKGEDFNPALSAAKWTPPAGIEKGIPKDEAVKTEIPLSELSIGERAYNGAASNYFRKRGSKTKGPVSIFYNPDNGQYLVEDGMHRIVQAHQEGKETIPAKIWSGYSENIANVRPEDKMDMSPIEHEAVGVHDDDLPYRAKYQSVDFHAPDLQDSGKKVTPETIRKDYAGGDKNASIYQSYIPMEDLPTPKFPTGEENFDREDYRSPRTGSPIKVEVGKDGNLSILDGNHRVSVWEDQGQQYAPAWVVDRRGPNIENLSEQERADREEEENPEGENFNPALAAKKQDDNTYWHGSPSGDLRGGANGLHVGTREAAKQALEARIGIPADGKPWDGTRKYGETLLAGKKTLEKMDPRGYNQTGYNARPPEEDFYPSKAPKYGDGSDVSMDSKPDLFPVKIKGEMSNTPATAHDDFKANGYMKGALKRGNAKRGFYYNNVGEDAGSVSAVVPNANHIERVQPGEEFNPALSASPEWQKRIADTEWKNDTEGKYPTGYRTLTPTYKGVEIGKLAYSGEPGDSYSRIRTSALKPEFRGKGIAKEMYKSAIEDARQRGIPEFKSDTVVSNDAQNVWRSLIRDGKYDITREYTKNYNANGGGGVEYTVHLGDQPHQYTKQQMTDLGADGYLSNAVKANIPLNRLEGLEPTPAMESGYQKGTPITQPIEVSRNPESGNYTLYSGNHRVTQAGINGDTHIPAFVEGATPEDLNAWKQGENFNPALSNPKGSTVPLMKKPLEVKGSGEGDEVSTLDIAKALNKYSRKQNPALKSGADAVKMTDRAKKLAIDEAKYQLAQGKTGTEWYTTEMKDHDKILQGMRPELTGGEMTDRLPDHPVKLSLFKAAEAILSSGQKPYANFKSAVKAWDAYNQTGEFPRINPANEKSWGPRGVDAYGNGFDGLNQLIQEKGEKGAADWLLSDHPVSELKQYNEWVSGKKDDMVPGAMILGEKRGPFMQNLHGIESAFTADMWVSRTWNRWMGTLDTNPKVKAKGKVEAESDVPRNNAERALMKESFEHAANKLGLTTSSLQAVLWYYEQALYRAHGIPVESWSFKDAAERVQREQAAPQGSPFATPTPTQHEGIHALDFLKGLRDTRTAPGEQFNPALSGPEAKQAAGVAALKQGQPIPTLPANWNQFGPKNPDGEIEQGNLDLTHRPVIQNADGSHSSEYSASFRNAKGQEVLVPTIVNGKFLTPDGKKPPAGSAAEKAMFKRAWQHYEETGEHLGIFDTIEHANAAANMIHNRETNAAGLAALGGR